MAKTPKSAPEQEGEISVSIVKFTMKGSDASLQKGLDNNRKNPDIFGTAFQAC